MENSKPPIFLRVAEDDYENLKKEKDLYKRGLEKVCEINPTTTQASFSRMILRKGSLLNV